MAAFRQHCSFGFWKSTLIFGETNEERDGMGHFGLITSLSDLPNETKLLNYVRRRSVSTTPASKKLANEGLAKKLPHWLSPITSPPRFEKTARLRQIFS
ncbi:MAG: hypothetical protein M3128_01400 [Verrucomicrobiota bacterium]|nr:hypothetical protein [Verrucomicrobiota bacterium]